MVISLLASSPTTKSNAALSGYLKSFVLTLILLSIWVSAYFLKLGGVKKHSSFQNYCSGHVNEHYIFDFTACSSDIQRKSFNWKLTLSMSLFVNNSQVVCYRIHEGS